MLYVNAMTTKQRLVVRLTPEQRRRLEELAAEANLSMTETMHRLIDRAYDKFLAEDDVTGQSHEKSKAPDGS
jgi:hypothetical protein